MRVSVLAIPDVLSHSLDLNFDFQETLAEILKTASAFSFEPPGVFSTPSVGNTEGFTPEFANKDWMPEVLRAQRFRHWAPLVSCAS